MVSERRPLAPLGIGHASVNVIADPIAITTANPIDDALVDRLLVDLSVIPAIAVANGDTNGEEEKNLVHGSCRVDGCTRCDVKQTPLARAASRRWRYGGGAGRNDAACGKGSGAPVLPTFCAAIHSSNAEATSVPD